jgi:hypothetical protein
MAYLPEDDKQQKDQVQGQVQTMTSGAPAPAAPSGGSVITGSGGSTAATTGNAGGNGWTNFQSYLKANAGNTASSDNLKQTVGQHFTQDQSKLQETSNKVKTDAQSFVQSNKMGQDKASQLLSEAAYNGGQLSRPAMSGIRNVDQFEAQSRGSISPDAEATPQPTEPAPSTDFTLGRVEGKTYEDRYNTAVGALRNRRELQYGGPSQYSFNESADTANYGGQISDQKRFGSLMDQLYRKNSGGAISRGALSLQRQIDGSNGNLEAARQDLANQYTGLKKNITDTVSGTQAALKSAQDEFAADTGALNTFLSNSRHTDENVINNAVKGWNEIESAAKAQALARAQQLREEYNYNREDPVQEYLRNGGQATAETVSGVDPARDRFNALVDILRSGYKINPAYSNPLKHVELDEEGYTQAIKPTGYVPRTKASY